MAMVVPGSWLLVALAAGALAGWGAPRLLRRRPAATAVPAPGCRERASGSPRPSCTCPVFENTPAVKLLLDLQSGRILDANRSAVAFYGHPREQLRACRLADLVAGDPTPVAEGLRRARAGEQPVLPLDQRRASGEIRETETVVGAITVEGRTLLHVLVHDVTDRQEAMRRLRASEERFRAIADHTYDLETWVDPQGQLVWANPAYYRATGRTAAQCRAMPDYPTPTFHPEDREPMRELFRGALAGSRGNDVAFRLLSADGSWRWYAISWQPIADQQGRPLGVRASMRDITVRRALDEERERLLGELREALQQVKTLRGLLPICARCKRIRDESDHWEQMEKYVTEHSEAMFSHGLCPECERAAYREAGLEPPEDRH
jgi:PAS domain S-box-containing protein